MAEKRLNYCAWPALTGFAIFAILAVASNPVRLIKMCSPTSLATLLSRKMETLKPIITTVLITLSPQNYQRITSF